MVKLSLITSCKKVVSIKKKSSDKWTDYLGVLRGLFNFWMVIGHFIMFLMGYKLGVTETNTKYNVALFVNVMVFRVCAVSIFMLSGISTSRWFVRQINTNDKQSDIRLMAKFFVSRLTNITPFYFLVAGFYVFYVNRMASDHLKENTPEMCNNALPSMLTFTSNYFHETQPCMLWNWTLVCLVQLCLITPIFIMAFKRNRNFGHLVAISGLIVSIAISFHSVYSNRINKSYLDNDGIIFRKLIMSAEFIPNSYVPTIHTKPYIYAQPYIIGIIIGYLIEDNKFNYVLSSEKFKAILKLSWILYWTSITINILSRVISTPFIVFNAIDCSLIYIVIAVIYVNYLARLPDLPIMKSLMRSRVLAVVINSQRASYLIHPLFIVITFNHLLYFDWQLDMASFTTMGNNLIVYLVLNYSASSLATVVIIKPFEHLSSRLTKMMFGND